MFYRAFIFTILTGLLALFSRDVVAQNTKLVATVNKNTVAIHEQFKLTFKVNAHGENFSPPKLEDFRLYSGPNQSSSMQWVNGVMSSSISYTYVLSPRKEGKLEIDPAKITVGGKVYKSEPVYIKAVKAKTQNQGQKTPKNTSSNGGNASLDSQLKENVFIRASVNNRNPFVGEHITATYKLYYRVDPVNLQADKLPSFQGFAAEDVELKTNQAPDEVLNGVQYRVLLVKQSVLFPQKSGELEIDPLKLKTVLRIRTQNRRRSMFDQFFGGYQDVAFDVASPSLKIKVKPLPSAGKPKSFAGAVGNFVYESSLDKDSVGENEAINLKVLANGTGNIALVPEPQFNFPVDFEVYDPKVNTNKTVSASGMRGKKSYEYLMIPRHSGRFQIEAKPFSFFDPDKEKYVEIPAKTFDIQVGEVSDAEDPTAVNFARRKEAVKFVGKDIRFINTGDPLLQDKDDTFFGSTGFYIGLSSPFILLLLGLFAQNRMKHQNTNIELIKRRRAASVAKKHLQKASALLKESKLSQFYQELSAALFGYTSDKLNVERSNLSKQRIADALRKKAVEEKDIREWESLIEACEMARFAPSSDADAQELLARADQNLQNLERKLS